MRFCNANELFAERASMTNFIFRNQPFNTSLSLAGSGNR